MSAETSDPRADELLHADPERIGSLAGFLQQAAQQSAHTSLGLRAAQHDVVWHGHAADTFRAAIGAMPARLDGLDAGFRDTSAALNAYAAALERLQAVYRRGVAELATQRARLSGARADAEAAGAALRRAIYNPAPPAQLTAAQREVDRTQRQLAEVTDDLTQVRRRVGQCLDEFERERAGCRIRIGDARRLAPPSARPSPVQARLQGPITADLAPPA